MEGVYRQGNSAGRQVMSGGSGNGDDLIRVARVALVAATLLLVVWAVSGIVQARSRIWERQPYDSRLAPSPSDLTPPVNSGGCLVSSTGWSIVTRAR